MLIERTGYIFTSRVKYSQWKLLEFVFTEMSMKRVHKALIIFMVKKLKP
jgi:hypothetical protein